MFDSDTLLFGSLRRSVMASIILPRLYELVPDDLIVLVETQLEDIALCQLEVADALSSWSREHGADLRPQALAEGPQDPRRPGRPSSENAVCVRP